MNYKAGKIAQQIIALQNEDGTWGNEFHSLSIPCAKKPLTTEQALRRLKNLGFTIEDVPVRKAVDYMIACLKGERKLDNYWEKTMDWNLFTKLMLSTWVKIFVPDNEIALDFSGHWVNIIEKAFANGTYDNNSYQNAYREEFGQRAKGTRELDFVSFYHINLLQGVLKKETESSMLDYVINYDEGIYYIYGKPLKEVPKVFSSIETSRYLASLEILAGYESAKEKLGFVVEWLEENRDENGQWDLGAKVKDNLYFPLSDSWRNVECRKLDCTEKITSIISRLRL